MNETPDITLGAGNSLPSTSFVLRYPRGLDGSLGAPVDLTGATLTFEYQLQDLSAAAEVLTTVVITSAAAGAGRIDWPTGVDVIPGGEYNARIHADFPSTGRMSWPNGKREDGTEFYWFHVAPGFTEVTP